MFRQGKEEPTYGKFDAKGALLSIRNVEDRQYLWNLLNILSVYKELGNL